MGNICGNPTKPDNYSEEAYSERLQLVMKKDNVNVIYDIDKSTCFKSEIGPHEQLMNILDVEATELDESCL